MTPTRNRGLEQMKRRGEGNPLVPGLRFMCRQQWMYRKRDARGTFPGAVSDLMEMRI